MTSVICGEGILPLFHTAGKPALSLRNGMPAVHARPGRPRHLSAQGKTMKNR
jgi:hypothetical protein